MYNTGDAANPEEAEVVDLKKGILGLLPAKAIPSFPIQKWRRMAR